jgi:hypothetical protein
MNEPHWLVQELAGEAVWTALALGAAWAWTKREVIRNRFGVVTVPMKPATLKVEGAKGTVYLSAVGDGIGEGSGTVTVGAVADLRWKVEAPTPSLARRLEDLAAWYLNVS